MSYTNGLDKPSDYFNTKLYTGNGSTQSIDGINFQPDFTWIKCRNLAFSHLLFDVSRGATKFMKSNATDAEATNVNFLTSFDSDGFSLGNDSAINGSSDTYTSWNWLAGGTGVSNTDGSITSTVSANTTSGFSIVKYTGNAVSGATVGHGLGATPKMIIIKSLDNGTTPWVIYHSSLGNTQKLYFDTQAQQTTGNWSSTSPTSSVFTISGSEPNASGENFIAYCFAEKKGFSKFGSYTGNGSSDGTFIYTGFRPAFFLYKLSSSAGQNWTIHDNKRIGYNPVGHLLHPDLSNAESNQQSGSLYVSDFCSNGIKIRGSDANINGSGNTYIYMAFAEHPLVSSTGVPCTAR